MHKMHQYLGKCEHDNAALEAKGGREKKKFGFDNTKRGKKVKIGGFKRANTRNERILTCRKLL